MLHRKFLDGLNSEQINNGGSAFNVETIEKRIQELKYLPPFAPDKYEPRYTVTHLFKSGVECTLYFVLRNGEQIFYKSEERAV